MQLQRIEKEDFYRARDILKSLFPAFNEMEFVFGDEGEKVDNSYYLLGKDGENIGIVNAYRYKICNRSLWIGWFGILENYRRKGLGSQTLALFEIKAKMAGHTHIRLFTDKFENNEVIEFYQKNGYTKEDYYSEKDPSSKTYKVVIFSKNLNGGKVEPWNNKNINITLELKKQL